MDSDVEYISSPSTNVSTPSTTAYGVPLLQTKRRIRRSLNLNRDGLTKQRAYIIADDDDDEEEYQIPYQDILDPYNLSTEYNRNTFLHEYGMWGRPFPIETPSTNVSRVPSLFATLTPGAIGYGSLQNNNIVQKLDFGSSRSISGGERLEHGCDRSEQKCSEMDSGDNISELSGNDFGYNISELSGVDFEDDISDLSENVVDNDNFWTQKEQEKIDQIIDNACNSFGGKRRR